MVLNSIRMLSVTETWLVEGVFSSFVDIPGYKFFRSDSPSGIRKHGVGVYVCELIVAVPVAVEVPNVLVLRLVDFGIYVVSVFRPPSNSVEENERLLSFIFDFSLGKTVLLLGDFNLPTLKWYQTGLPDGYIAPLDQKFSDVFSISGLRQWVHEPTFLPSGNILDLVFTTC